MIKSCFRWLLSNRWLINRPLAPIQYIQPFIRLLAQALLLIGGLWTSFAVIADSEQQAQLAELKQAISTLEDKLQRQRGEKDSLQQQLKNIELKASEVTSNIRQSRTEITATELELSELAETKQQLQRDIARQSSAIAEQIRISHRTGSEEPIKLLLNQQDPQKLARVFKYYDYLLAARSEKIEQFKADIDQLTALEETINKHKIRLARSRKTLEAERRALVAAMDDRTDTLQQVQQQLRSGRQQLLSLQGQRDELQALIDTVERAAAKLVPPTDYPSFSASKGKLRWPVAGSVSQRFGSRRTGDLRWQGLLIKAEPGIAVRAVHHGRVVFSNYLRGFGLLIIVDHGDGYMSLYAHNEVLLKDTGAWIQSDEIVARAGNTGGLASTALYFEIRQQGSPVDPIRWLRRRSAS